MFARRLQCAHTVSTRHPKQRNLKHIGCGKTVHVAFSGSSKFRKSSWKTTNRRNLHQRHQQHASIIQRCVGFDVCTSFAVCAHSFHTTSKTTRNLKHIGDVAKLYTSLFLVHQIQEKQLENEKSTKSSPMTPTAR